MINPLFFTRKRPLSSCALRQSSHLPGRTLCREGRKQSTNYLDQSPTYNNYNIKWKKSQCVESTIFAKSSQNLTVFSFGRKNCFFAPQKTVPTAKRRGDRAKIDYCSLIAACPAPIRQGRGRRHLCPFGFPSGDFQRAAARHEKALPDVFQGGMGLAAADRPSSF